MDAKTNPTSTDTALVLNLLHEVAQGSSHIATMSRLIVDHADDQNGAVTFALTAAIEVLSKRNGWLADLASDRLGDDCSIISSNANVWLMPAGLTVGTEG